MKGGRGGQHNNQHRLQTTLLLLILLGPIGLLVEGQIEGPGWNFYDDPFYNGLLVEDSGDDVTTPFEFDWMFTATGTENGIHSNYIYVDNAGDYIIVGTFKSQLSSFTHFYSKYSEEDISPPGSTNFASTSSFSSTTNTKSNTKSNSHNCTDNPDSPLLNSCNHTVFIYKMSPEGHLHWQKQFHNMNSHSRSYCFSVVTSSSNEIIVTGAFIGEISIDGTHTKGNDVTPLTFFAGFSPLGKLLWFHNFTTPSINLCSDLAASREINNDYVYALGYFANQFTYQGSTYKSAYVTYFLIKFLSNTGKVMWVDQGCGIAGTTNIYASQVEIDLEGNPTFVGSFTGRIIFKKNDYHIESPDSKLSVYVIKINPGGHHLSSIFVGGPDSTLCTHRHYIKISPNTGNHYISGCFNGTINFYNSSNFILQNGTLPVIWNITNALKLQNSFSTYMTVYDSQGGIIWVNQIGGSQAAYGGSMDLVLGTNSSMGGIQNESVALMGFFSDSIRFYSVEGAGNSTVVNASTVNETNAGYLVEFNINGNLNWISTFDGMISVGSLVVVQSKSKKMLQNGTAEAEESYFLGTGSFRGLSAWGNYSIKYNTDTIYIFRMSMDEYYEGGTTVEFYRDAFFWLFAAVSVAAFVVVNWIAVVVAINVLRRKGREWQLRRQLEKEKKASRSKFASSYISLQKETGGTKVQGEEEREKDAEGVEGEEDEEEFGKIIRKKRREGREKLKRLKEKIKRGRAESKSKRNLKGVGGEEEERQDSKRLLKGVGGAAAEEEKHDIESGLLKSPGIMGTEDLTDMSRQNSIGEFPSLSAFNSKEPFADVLSGYVTLGNSRRDETSSGSD